MVKKLFSQMHVLCVRVGKGRGIVWGHSQAFLQLTFHVVWQERDCSPSFFLTSRQSAPALDGQCRQVISWSSAPTWLSNFATVNSTANFSRKGITSDFLPVLLDLPLPLSFATRCVRAIPCTRAVLFLLSFPKECFASHAEPIRHSSESKNIKQTKNVF